MRIKKRTKNHRIVQEDLGFEKPFDDPVPTGSALMEYDQRRARASQQFKILGHGSRTLASYDVRVTMPSISNVLVGRVIDNDILKVLEAWLEQRPEFQEGSTLVERGHKKALPTPWR